MIPTIETVVDSKIVIRSEADSDSLIVRVSDGADDTIIVRVAEQGPAGAGDKYYDHDQMIASALWTVNHNLGKYPAVEVVDSSGAVVEGYITHVSANQLMLSFTTAFAGHAYCN